MTDLNDKKIAYERGGNAFENGYLLCHNPYLKTEEWYLAARWELGWQNERISVEESTLGSGGSVSVVLKAIAARLELCMDDLNMGRYEACVQRLNALMSIMPDAGTASRRAARWSTK